MLGSGTVALAQPQDPGRPYWSDNWRGWHFYEEPEIPPPEPPASTPRQAATASSAATAPRRSPAKPPEIVEFERLQKALEERRHIAIMRPTEANVRRYMELEAQVVSRASTFADVAQRIAWASPELDPTLQGRPVNAKALEVFDQLQTAQRSQSISALGRDHVLFFFFRSDCPYCHAFAPTLEAFQARHGIKVVAISVDGGPIPGFADARRDNGIATTLRVSQVPAVYLAQPFTGKITPIGFGARQGSCRLIHAASGCLISAVECAVMTESRSGLRVTGPVGVQSRVAPDQRAGLRSRALRYSA
jgi:conjugal transfer pilus assembly protein TraF